MATESTMATESNRGDQFLRVLDFIVMVVLITVVTTVSGIVYGLFQEEVWIRTREIQFIVGSVVLLIGIFLNHPTFGVEKRIKEERNENDGIPLLQSLIVQFLDRNRPLRKNERYSYGAKMLVSGAILVTFSLGYELFFGTFA